MMKNERITPHKRNPRTSTFIQKVAPVAPTPPAGSIGDNEVPKPNKDKYH
jgi:hypothetical protein